MSEIDGELAGRLSRLAAAVPVGRAELDPVHRGAVAARQAVRLAWITPVFVLVVAVLVGSTVVGLGANGPVSTLATDGDFEVSIHSPKGHWVQGEAIQVEGSLTYRGPDAAVDISHGHGTPLGFSIVEPVDGMTLGLGWRQSCERSILPRDAPIVSSFRKSGGYDNADPLAGRYRAWFADPELHLPVGTWHLYVLALFSEGQGCQGTGHEIRAEIEIVVKGSATEPSATQAVTDAPPGAGSMNPSRTQIVLRTASAPHAGWCLTALGGGTLALNPRTGIGFETNGVLTGVVWPYGWTAWRDGDGFVLLDADGDPEARSGDRVSYGGGHVGDDDTFTICGGPLVSPAPT